MIVRRCSYISHVAWHANLNRCCAYERGSTLVTTNLPFDEWTEVLGSERLTGALLDRLTHHVNILEMNGDSYRLNQGRRRHTPTAN